MADLVTPPPEESNSGRVLKGFLAMSASSFLVMGIQLVYAALTSRLLPPSAFGAYAVALSGVGLIGMLGGSSLGQSAARRDHDSAEMDRSLVSLAALVGGVTAIAAIVLAPLWGHIWGNPSSVVMTRLLALGIPLSAVLAVFAGVLRRSGKTSVVAVRTAIGQLTGLVIGLAVVLHTRAAWSLGIASVAGLALSTALLGSSLPHKRLKPMSPTKAVRADVSYAVKAAGMNVLRLSTNQIPVWSISRFAGPNWLGSYNRAMTLVTVPLETLQTSFSYSLFPELRQNGPVFRSPSSFTDILVLVTWPAIFLAGIGYFAVPPLLSLILGGGWEQARALAGVAVLLGAVPIVGVPLAAALEARGQFRAVTLGWFVGTLAIALGAVVTARTASPMPAMVGLLGAASLPMLIFGAVLSRVGLLRLTVYLEGVRAILILQVSLVALFAVGEQLLDSNRVGILAIVVGMVEASALWAVRRRTRCGRIAARHYLPGFR